MIIWKKPSVRAGNDKNGQKTKQMTRCPPSHALITKGPPETILKRSPQLWIDDARWNPGQLNLEKRSVIIVMAFDGQTCVCHCVGHDVRHGHEADIPPTERRQQQPLVDRSHAVTSTEYVHPVPTSSSAAGSNRVARTAHPLYSCRQPAPAV
ncbi:uncharacterized protein PGTG_04285 [Puccinia graminis f. sp. tritici CRL 75-36-700-3]|uniref:Uncharacterized protein n=1 Tax=Puccinia graminis f. sp. tritici (strain CRL 75-36-700-3 / race SCCL) TaxID=418459 RepID=E3K1W0_PUCGT|nr:uncharacterized protein PGTG_04285 [Puccinia graminis f. sp. tritici CRL 75-36-700-3]EFP78329.2 hypothetical protein PGTG_04285 [Puccinia graminis f. sp. tritici CRL 75-36-700-3]